MTSEIENSLAELEKWLKIHKYEGYEPYDGLSSYLRPLTFGSCLAERMLEQIVLRCPFHIRPLFGIKVSKSASGMGLLVRGYLRIWVLTKDIEYKNKATSCLNWLTENHLSGYSDYCWGLNFDHASRVSRTSRYVPDVVSTK